MISAGDGTLLPAALFGLSQLHAGAPGAGAGSGAGRGPVDVAAAGWRGRVSGVLRARLPAVAVFGLRRSGRTGNGGGPRGRIAPACQAGPLSSHLMTVR